MPTFNGTSGADNISGSAGDDIINGLGGNDTLDGAGGNDVINGGTGNDTMTGGSGNDTFLYSARNFDLDTITDFTIGTDRIDLSALNVADLATLQPFISQSGLNTVISLFYGGSSETITLNGITAANLTAADFVFNSLTTALAVAGTTSSDVLFGGNGNDTISGGGGNDRLTGGAGADYLLGGTGNDTQTGGSGADIFAYAARNFDDDAITDFTIGTDRIDLSALNVADLATLQPFISQSGLNTVISLFYGGSSETITLNGITAANLTAADFVFNSLTTALAVAGTTSSDVLFGGNGNDTISAGGGNDTVDGGAGDDSIDASSGNDTIRGGLGNDTILGGLGNDTIDGGDGIGDTASYADITAPVSVNLNLTSAQNTVNGGSDTLVNIENLTGTSFNDTLRGNALANVLTGAGGDDLIFGGDGGDLIFGDAGVNTLIGEGGDDRIYNGSTPGTLQGGIGNDQYIVNNTGDSIVEFANEGVDEVRTFTTSYTLAANVENLVALNTSNPFLGLGNASDNAITGSGQRDELFGYGGNDTLNDGGGANADTLIGGTGNDIYIVGNRGSSTIELANEGIDEVRTTFSIFALQNNVENLTATDTAAHQALVGNNLDNVITGNTGTDDLFGRDGNDTLDGGTGAANTLLGQIGDDQYLVRAIGDSVIEFTGEGTDTVRANVASFTLPTNVENLVFVAGGNALGVGNALDNAITGNSGNDFLNGNGGNDILTGGSGADELFGGAGADRFHYLGGETGLDRIYDFQPGTDRIALNSAFYTPNANAVFVAGAGAAATNGQAAFLYDTNTGIVSYDADGTGAGAAVQLAQLNLGLSLTIADFVFA